MRLTMKPGVSLQLTGRLPACSAHSYAFRTASSLERRARTISTSGKTGAGLKKCMPTTRSGRSHRLGDLGDRERRCVRREDGVRSRDAVELGEELALRFELFHDRLDDEIAVREIPDFSREREPPERRIALVRAHALLLDGAAEVALDRRAPALGELHRHLAADRLVPGGHADLRDARTHGSQPDDADLHAGDPSAPSVDVAALLGRAHQAIQGRREPR